MYPAIVDILKTYIYVVMQRGEEHKIRVKLTRFESQLVKATLLVTLVVSFMSLRLMDLNDV